MELCFLAEATRCGRQSFVALKEPSTSMSMTDLKALGESWESGARKLPAAPALDTSISWRIGAGGRRREVHEEVYSTQFIDTSVDCFLEGVGAANVDGANAEYFRA